MELGRQQAGRDGVFDCGVEARTDLKRRAEALDGTNKLLADLWGAYPNGGKASRKRRVISQAVEIIATCCLA